MNLDRYIDLIKSGEVVAFPTETVYGLGADAWNPDAIAKVFKIKGRPSDNPLIVHISDEAQIEDFALDIPDHAHRLIKAFWPGPLTLVLNKKPEVLDAVTAGLNTVALRMPEHPLALSLIKETGALVAPSANKSGSPSPTKAAHVFADFGDDFPVIDGEATRIGLESTVVDLTESFPAILRPGSISRKQIEDVLDTFVEESFFHHIEKPRSPGQKYSHYKPKAEVRWLSDDETMHNSKALYLVQSSSVESKNIIVYHNDLTLMARELYDRFREADIEGFTSVVIERFERKSPIAEALLNRISKAISN
ncbi:MAG: L-threonylcarbamoyladenylate synthase [bacterium]|nr:L-threonylcarbamoyladenylate synthase [bacterium]